MLCIIFNIFSLALLYDGATPSYILLLERINLFFTCVFILEPSIINILGLMFVLFFIYSVLGVFMFKDIELEDDPLISFQNFGLSFQTLISCSIGGGNGWHYLMKTLRKTGFNCNFHI